MSAENFINFLNILTDTYTKLQIRLADTGVLEYISKYIDMIVVWFSKLINSSFNNIVGSIASLGGNIISTIISCVITFYILVNKLILVNILKLI